MPAHTFTAGFLACGLGAGARGFVEARAVIGQHAARFVNLGGIDIDRAGLEDFERLSGGPGIHGDLHTMQPADLVRAWRRRRPDVVFSSTPCKGLSRLLGSAAAQLEHYQALNRLTVEALHLVVTTYADDPVPLILLENVPGIMSRGAELLDQIRQLLVAHGYRLDERTHDCGEVGGLGQHRRRFLLVARHEAKLPALLFQPPRQRVKACGEIIGPLPLPNDPAAGPLHVLPRISWINWVRLALIPPGGDWRDLPRAAALEHEPHRGGHGVQAWGEPSKVVRGASNVRTGPASVADPRVAVGATGANAASFKGRPGYLGVLSYDDPTPAVTGNLGATDGTSPGSVADPRLVSPLAEGQPRREVHRRHAVAAWGEAFETVTGPGSNAVENIADLRIPLTCSPRSGAYGVLDEGQPADTVTGSASIDNGRVAIADGRELRPLPPGYVVMTIEECLAEATSPKARPPEGTVPVIFSPTDGTWHRPLTTLELAALQGLPATLDGEPLTLAGRSGASHRERIGNAVPVGAAKAIAEQMLRTLLAGALGLFLMDSCPVWVRRAAVPELYLRRRREEPAQDERVAEAA